MNASVFFDTNILVYAAIGTGKDQGKHERALDLIQSEDFGTSAQVLQEFFVTVVKKAARPLSALRALEWIEQWSEFPCQPIDHRLVRIAIERSCAIPRGRSELSRWRPVRPSRRYRSSCRE